jgi:hypothetical protein
MFFMEQSFLSEEEAMHFIEESALTDEGRIEIQEKLLDPVIKVLKTPSGLKKYLDLGNEFIDLNAEMLAKQFPTTKVIYPRRYVDDVLGLFGFTPVEMKKLIKEILQKHVNASDWNSIVAYPTNIIHVMAMIYSDSITAVDPNDALLIGKEGYKGRNRLRDSARQQYGLTSYQMSFAMSFPSPPIPSIMEYTYMHLDRSWNIVKDENMVTWIGESIETCYAFYRTKIGLGLTPQILADMLNRVRNTFRQNMRTLAQRYYADVEANNSVAEDTDDTTTVETLELTKIRTNLLRRISNGDDLYRRMNSTYKAIANLKAIKQPEVLYNFAQRVEKKDIGKIIDLILFVFITKEGNKISDINTSKYIGRITKFPTAVDRALPGKPVIIPMCRKYGESNDTIIKAYICFVATYIMQRINDVVDKLLSSSEV